MTFSTTTDAEGQMHYFADGYEVPQKVFDTLLPSKLFPVATGLTQDMAMAILKVIKDETPPVETYKGPRFSTAISGVKPLKSNALAVHPRQIPAVLARNKKHGINVRYDRRGRPCFTDAGQRQALCKLEGVRSLNSAYGY